MSDWLASLRALLPPGRVSSDLKELRRHASDAWSVAIKVRLQDRDTYQPQAVAYPHDRDEVARLLEWAHERRIAITPWGAGSSVTGAPLPLTGGVTVDLSRMDAPASIDRVNLLVTAQAGVRGDRLERALNDAGLTLGHSPQSLDRSTVGGWVATRATGQFSSRYGGIEDLVVALTAVLPTGEVVHTQPAVRPPFGPDVNALFIGAEGTLGIVTQVTLRVVPLPAARLLEAVRFASVDAGLDAMRSIMQRGHPAVPAALLRPGRVAPRAARCRLSRLCDVSRLRRGNGDRGSRAARGARALLGARRYANRARAGSGVDGTAVRLLGRGEPSQRAVRDRRDDRGVPSLGRHRRDLPGAEGGARPARGGGSGPLLARLSAGNLPVHDRAKMRRQSRVGPMPRPRKRPCDASGR